MSEYNLFCEGQTVTHTPSGRRGTVTKTSVAGDRACIRVRFDGMARSRAVSVASVVPHPAVWVYRHYFRPEHQVEGDIVAVAYIDGHPVRPYTCRETIDCTPDPQDQGEGAESAVDKAVEYLRDHSLTEASSQGDGVTSGWFCHVDGSTIENQYTGERCEASAHLYGFTDAEEAEIDLRIRTGL